MASSETRKAPSDTDPAPPVAGLLVREAHKAAEAVADDAVAFLGELHPDLLAGMPSRFEDVLRLAVHQASLRWICGVSIWWAREAQDREPGGNSGISEP